MDALAVAALTLVLAPLVASALSAIAPGGLGSALAFPVLLLLLALLTVGWVQIRFPGALHLLRGRRTFHARDVLAGVAHGVVAFFVINLGFALVISLIAHLLGADMPTVQEGIRERATDQQHAPFVLVSIVLVAPIAEELYFRGMLFQTLHQSLGMWPGIGLSAAVFGLAHYEAGNPEGTLYAFMVLFAVGMYLAWVFARREHLAAPVAMHATFNSAAAIGILAGLA